MEMRLNKNNIKKWKMKLDKKWNKLVREYKWGNGWLNLSKTMSDTTWIDDYENTTIETVINDQLWIVCYSYHKRGR
ncbi:MAG: hypothetical protein PHP92_03795 [Candidatus Nanoarchaeia archaeon]|nr:hypothetical protein [Candidatus Nanoarchaeia archaeon]